MTQTNWGREYPAPNFGRDLNAGTDFGQELGGTNFGRDLGGGEFGQDVDPPLAWYSTRLLATRPASLVSYLRLSEPFGSTAADASGNGRTGAYVGVDLQQPGIGDGLTAPGLDGTGDYINWYSASLAAAFNAAAGTLIVWAWPSSEAVWSDATLRHIVNISAAATTDLVAIRKNTAGSVVWVYVGAAGSSKSVSLVVSGVQPRCYAITWDKAVDELRAYLDGVQVGMQTGLGTWSGPPASTRCCIGSQTTTPAGVWKGGEAHAALYNAALTPAELAPLGRVS